MARRTWPQTHAERFVRQVAQFGRAPSEKVGLQVKKAKRAGGRSTVVLLFFSSDLQFTLFDNCT